MYQCNKNVKILNDLPMKKWNGIMCVDVKAICGMVIDVEYFGVVCRNIKIVEVLNEYENKKRPRYKWEYGGRSGDIECQGFLNGRIGKLLNIDLNNKYIDENNVVHIFITNRKGQQFEALYSGDHIEEVMNTTWNVQLRNNGSVSSVCTGNYNGNTIFLHQVDFPNSKIIDHIDNNALNNKIDNLRYSNAQENSKNKKVNGASEIVGIVKGKKTWCSKYSDTTTKSIIRTIGRECENEAKIDALIAQRYMGYKHNEDMFYLLDNLPQERIKEVEELLQHKIDNAKNKVRNEIIYNHKIEDCGGYYKLIKGKDEMLFDCDLEFIKRQNVGKAKGYWIGYNSCNNTRTTNRFHRVLLDLKPTDYIDYALHVDHLNGNTNDNRYENIVIATSYSNQCNKYGKGYRKTPYNTYVVQCMNKYKYWELIGGIREPKVKTEEEAIAEVERRKAIIDNARVKLKSREELDELIQYCLDNNYKKINNQGTEIADLDLGYLYWKGILNPQEVAS